MDIKIEIPEGEFSPHMERAIGKLISYKFGTFKSVTITNEKNVLTAKYEYADRPALPMPIEGFYVITATLNGKNYEYRYQFVNVIINIPEEHVKSRMKAAIGFFIGWEYGRFKDVYITTEGFFMEATDGRRHKVEILAVYEDYDDSRGIRNGHYVAGAIWNGKRYEYKYDYLYDTVDSKSDPCR